MRKNLAVTLTLGLGLATVLIPQSFAAPTEALSARELNQLRMDIDRERRRETLRAMKERQKESTAVPDAQPPAPAGEFLFRIEKVSHTPSTVLTEDEWTKVTSTWVGKDVTSSELVDLLKAVNGLYRKKGYAVCLAIIRPQRISNGDLTVTLIEGKTGRVTITGANNARESYYRGAIAATEGEVANYREMVNELVRFNMTNQAQMAVDIHPGDAVGTTDYTVTVSEPSRWGATVFADSNGAKSTGRARGGASFVNRSLFGFNDTLWLMGVANEGTQTVTGSYSFPLTRFGTRLSLTASAGHVKVLHGASADRDVKGRSSLVAARLEHPVFVGNNTKTTLYVERSRQGSKTDIYGDLHISDLVINAWSAGADWFLVTSKALVSASLSLSDRKARQRVSSTRYHYQLLSGTVSVSADLTDSLTTSLTGAWQARLAGDAAVSTDYFGLGTSGGVRGYDNDVISAENGFWVNWETTRWFDVGAPQRAGLFAFADAGRLSGYNPYEKNMLASVGFGVIWPLFKGANVRATASFPLKRHLSDDTNVSRARADFVASWVW